MVFREIFRFLAEHNKVQCIVTTGGGIEEDIIKCLGNFIIGDFNASGIELRKKENLPLKGIAGSNIRRQLKRLKDLFLIENVKNEYRINENETLINIFEEKIEKFYIKGIIDRIKDYLRTVK